MKLLKSLAIAATLGLPFTVQAQGLFSPAIIVNDSAITAYELDQRTRLLDLFGTNGDIATIAREQLIDDRLRLDFVTTRGLTITDEALNSAIEEFAGRTGRNVAELTAALASEGVAYETLRDYVKANSVWRDYVRRTYASNVTVSDSDIDAEVANTLGSTSSLSVLLSEIIIPAPEDQMAEAMALAERISQIRSTSEFSAAAAEYSAVRTREDGGRLPWRSITEFPEGLQNLLSNLKPGEATPPLQLDGAIAILQMRSIREASGAFIAPTQIEYAMLSLPNKAELRQQITAIPQKVDRCDDLYTVANDFTGASVERITAAPSQIANDLALEIARLDVSEISTDLTRNNNQTAVVVMVCDRSAGTVDREAITANVRSQILNGYADTLLAELRDNAVIVYK
ncbi:hypothetical protein BVC71_04650 [Marivivens niveibacter]|uniref:Parvulin-like PPIase n=1 Tax=Marivivens niveibacter TaxID=1930667 RepID=A0A251X2E8_9RHOB|nr:peptidylprolyl isomerase [Marivivens niveibacter]OUD10776.1 hypothetical protein BVC71_04650 [Marivivens niveibacter]